jgi:hypothetical protein
MIKLNLIFVFLMPMAGVYAQQEGYSGHTKDSRPVTGSKWHYLVEPGLMLVSASGHIGIGDLVRPDVTESPGDVFSRFHAGAILYAEAANEKWLFSSDLVYLKPKQDVTKTNVVVGGTAVTKQLGWELAALYRIEPWLAAGIGAQLNSVKPEFDLVVNGPNGPFSQGGSLSKSWVDPEVVVATRFELNDRWYLRFRANAGGFGIGSKFSWQAQGYADFHWTHSFQVSAGYRVMKEDYEEGSGSDYFLYNVITFGPVLRCGFNF